MPVNRISKFVPSEGASLTQYVRPAPNGAKSFAAKLARLGEESAERGEKKKPAPKPAPPSVK